MSVRKTQISGRFDGQPYQLKQEEYSSRYGKPVRTIRRWQQRGLPLDDPEAMGELLSPRGGSTARPTCCHTGCPGTKALRIIARAARIAFAATTEEE